MKKLILFFLLAGLLNACMKNYEDDPRPIEEGFSLKIGNATTTGDTAYAAPYVVLKFYLENIPGSIEDYAFFWDLGDGSTSIAASPEKSYDIGIYDVMVTGTPSSGPSIERSIILVVSNDHSYETTILLIEATSIPGGKYNYKIGLKTLAIEGYASISVSAPIFQG